MARIVGIARLSGMEIGELGGDRLAGNRRARIARHRDHRGIRERPVAGIDGRPVGGGQVVGVENVLHADRDAGQRSAGGVGRGKQCVAVGQRLEGGDGLFPVRDRVEAGGDRVARRQFTRGNGVSDRDDGLHVTSPRISIAGRRAFRQWSRGRRRSVPCRRSRRVPAFPRAPARREGSRWPAR